MILFLFKFGSEKSLRMFDQRNMKETHMTLREKLNAYGLEIKRLKKSLRGKESATRTLIIEIKTCDDLISFYKKKMKSIYHFMFKNFEIDNRRNYHVDIEQHLDKCNDIRKKRKNLKVFLKNILKMYSQEEDKLEKRELQIIYIKSKIIMGIPSIFENSYNFSDLLFWIFMILVSFYFFERVKNLFRKFKEKVKNLF